MNNSKDLNDVKLSGFINGITDTDDMYIKFGMTCIKNTNELNKNIFVSLNINRDLYNKYKDFFVKGKKVYVRGYLNSFSDKNKKIQNFITVTDIFDCYNSFSKNIKEPEPIIRYDSDGVMVWNGKRCESIPLAEDELKEMEELLSEFK